MTDTTNEATIALQEANAALQLELDTLRSKIQAKDAQDAQDRAAATAKAQQSSRPPNVQNKLNQRPTSSYIAPTAAEETLARKYFGSHSDARLANRLAFDNPAEYQRIRQIAINVGGLVG
jgi:hypothetical protein